jgi:hypothetical protein
MDPPQESVCTQSTWQERAHICKDCSTIRGAGQEASFPKLLSNPAQTILWWLHAHAKRFRMDAERSVVVAILET